MSFRRFSLLLLLALVALQGSCGSSKGKLRERIEGLRLAGIKVYSGARLSSSEQATLLAEFRTVDVSFFKIQERRDALLDLQRRKALYDPPLRRNRVMDDAFYVPNWPPIPNPPPRSASRQR